MENPQAEATFFQLDGLCQRIESVLKTYPFTRGQKVRLREAPIQSYYATLSDNDVRGKPVFKDILKLVYKETWLEQQPFEAWEVLLWQGDIREIYESRGIAIVGLQGNFRSESATTLTSYEGDYAADVTVLIEERTFEKLAMYFDHHVNYIPLSWILGFYVTLVINRFRKTYFNLAWPDATMFYLATYVRGNDESIRIFRRTVARLMNLANVIAMRNVSTSVKKRFPTLDHIINAGFMTDEEYIKFQTLNCPHPKYWMIMQWAMDLVTRAHEEGKITSERYVLKIHDEMMKYRASIGTILSYDWISLPLVYTQVVTIAVKSFFLACLLGRQFINPKNEDEKPVYYIDVYFPVFTFLQYIFYAGWLKVAESLINPLGEDDDDFELNYLIDRNLQLSYLIVDKNCYETPTVDRDVHWDQDLAEIAHTEASFTLKTKPEVGSAEAVTVTGAAAEQFLPSERNSRQPSLANSIQSGLNKMPLGSGLASSLKRKFSSRSNKSVSPPLGGRKRTLPLKRILEKLPEQPEQRNGHVGEPDMENP